jgi:hypothetical protein
MAANPRPESMSVGAKKWSSDRKSAKNVVKSAKIKV